MISRGTNQSETKRANSALIMEAIYRYAPVSRVEMSQMLRLTPPTVATNVNKLIDMGLVYEIGTSPNHSESPGRKPILLDFITDSRLSVGIELSPYRSTFVLTDLRGNIKVCTQTDPAPANYSDMLGFVKKGFSDLVFKSGESPKKVMGLGIGLPGFIDTDEGNIIDSIRRQWNNRPLAADISDLTGLPTQIENNVRARAIGSEIFNSTLASDFFIYFFVSHGLACPLVIKNGSYYGKTAGKGEIGHMVIMPDGPVCDTCGNRGCLEAVASEGAIIKRCLKIIEMGLPTILTEICEDEKDPSIDEILSAQKSGDPYVCNVMESAISYLGLGLANIINFIRPHQILIDAQILTDPANRDLFLETARKNIFGHDVSSISTAFLPPDRLRGAVGASAIAVEYFLKNTSID